MRVVQILHRGWDQHGNLPRDIRSQCHDTDQPTAALLDRPEAARPARRARWSSGAANSAARSTRQGKLTNDNYGRDHHPRNFCMWLAGGGIKGGIGLRRDRRLQLQRRRESGPRQRPQRHDPALPGHRPREVHVQVPGARPAAHRRRRAASHQGVAVLARRLSLLAGCRSVRGRQWSWSPLFYQPGTAIHSSCAIWPGSNVAPRRRNGLIRRQRQPAGTIHPAAAIECPSAPAGRLAKLIQRGFQLVNQLVAGFARHIGIWPASEHPRWSQRLSRNHGNAVNDRHQDRGERSTYAPFPPQ